MIIVVKDLQFWLHIGPILNQLAGAMSLKLSGHELQGRFFQYDRVARRKQSKIVHFEMRDKHSQGETSFFEQRSSIMTPRPRMQKVRGINE
jgi:hypothetical protein